MTGLESMEDFFFGDLIEGKCPKIESRRRLDFKAKELSGDWYGQALLYPMVEAQCHHCSLDIDRKGEINAKEEIQFGSHKLQIEDITGNVIRDEMFFYLLKDKVAKRFTLLEADPESFMIVYQCYDGIKHAMGDADMVEKHMYIAAIMSRNIEETDERIAELTEKLIERVPEIKSDNLNRIKQGNECTYTDF